MTKKTKKKPPNYKDFFENFLQDITFQFDPNDLSFLLRLPSFPVISIGSKKVETVRIPIDSDDSGTSNIESTEANNSDTTTTNNNADNSQKIASTTISEDDTHLEDEEFDFDLGELVTGEEPVRVKIHLKAYIKMALHALKYANNNLPRRKWVEVIGLMVGYVENEDTPLARMVVTDVYPIGHGNDVNVQIRNPQSFVKVYNKLNKGEIIVGWYHSHPSYGVFMSSTDYETQLRYQKLSAKNSLTAPIALVIDPTRISSKSYGFKIFRLKENLKEWETPKFEVLNCPLESLPGIMNTLLPLSEGKPMFLEYDHE